MENLQKQAKSEPKVHYPHCSLCGKNDTSIVQQCEDPFNVVKCKICRLVYVLPLPDIKWLTQHYDEQEYYSNWIDKQMPKRIVMWKNRFKGIKKYKQEGKLLDVGCGLGTFLNTARVEGFEVFGTELSEYSTKYAKEVHDLNIFRGTLEDAKYPKESFDLITIWHVLEHLLDPRATLNEIYRILKPGGLLVVAVPNVNNLIMQWVYFLAKRRKLKYFSVEDKELHLTHFSEKTLSALLHSVGFRPVEVGVDDNQIAPAKKFIDYLALGLKAVTKLNYANAIRIYAIKPEHS